MKFMQNKCTVTQYAIRLSDVGVDFFLSRCHFKAIFSQFQIEPCFLKTGCMQDTFARALGQARATLGYILYKLIRSNNNCF